jgi:zinc and cadmium transporter
MTQTVLAAVAGAAFTLVSLVAAARSAPSDGLRAAAAGVAGGILLALAFAELFPEALEQAGHEWAALGFMAGFVALFAVEAVTKSHTHHGHEHDRSELRRHSLAAFVLGLGIHNLADGFTVAASTEVSNATGAGVATGVLVHQLPVGISFAAVLLALQTPRAFVVKTAVALGALIPAGAAIVVALPSMSSVAFGILLGAASGALVYIGAGHLLPEVHSERSTWTAAAVFPLALVATTLLFVQVLGND